MSLPAAAASALWKSRSARANALRFPMSARMRSSGAPIAVELGGARAAGREPGDVDLEARAQLEQLGGALLPDQQPPAQGLRQQLARRAAQVGSRARPHVDDPEDLERRERFAHRRAADARASPRAGARAADACPAAIDPLVNRSMQSTGHLRHRRTARQHAERRGDLGGSVVGDRRACEQPSATCSRIRALAIGQPVCQNVDERLAWLRRPAHSPTWRAPRETR